jgi:hypothetical protein
MEPILIGSQTKLLFHFANVVTLDVAKLFLEQRRPKLLSNSVGSVMDKWFRTKVMAQ